MNISEEDYVNELEEKFKSFGWKTYREVIPDECRMWNHQFKVDLIIYKEAIGYIGIEAKVISINNGGILAQAHKQITKYRDKNYFEGHKIKLWAIAIKFDHPLHIPYQGSVEILTREFFCAYGIGYVMESLRVPKIDFGYSQGWAKIPFEVLKGFDIERIEMAQEKKKGILRTK